MIEDEDVNRAIIDRGNLPPKWPTHRHSPEFWEQLGRTVGHVDKWRSQRRIDVMSMKPKKLSAVLS